jgi:hypothetical protein
MYGVVVCGTDGGANLHRGVIIYDLHHGSHAFHDYLNSRITTTIYFIATTLYCRYERCCYT